MALSFAFRQSLKRETRWHRRVAVLGFACLVLVTLLSGKAILLVPLLIGPLGGIYGGIFQNDARRTRVMIGSLDERAFLRHGVLFEELTEEQQHRLLVTYRVGNYVWTPLQPQEDVEARAQGKRKATHDAYRVLRWFALPTMAVYALGWYVLPKFHVRVLWTHWLVIGMVTVLLCFALPRLLWKWREPDDIPISAYPLPKWI